MAVDGVEGWYTMVWGVNKELCYSLTEDEEESELEEEERLEDDELCARKNLRTPKPEQHNKSCTPWLSPTTR